MTEHEIDGFVYRVMPMDARKQLHVARRILPIVGRIGKLSGAAPQPPEGGQEATGGEPVPAAGMDSFTANFFDEIAAGLKELADEDVDYILDTCLSVVSRKVGDTDRYQPVFNKVAKQMQFPDINMVQMMQLAVLVIQDNLSTFTNAPGQLGMLNATFAPRGR